MSDGRTPGQACLCVGGREPTACGVLGLDDPSSNCSPTLSEPVHEAVLHQGAGRW
jgi:hypothetical protein